jgi:tRNA nucleotidyltransferase (CCA-adding enzyme)
MKNYLINLNPKMKKLVYQASEVACRNNMPAYLVGGFVRDLILNSKNLDLDIVIEGDGIKFAQELADKLHAKLIQHRRFFTATLILKSNLKCDIATARREFYPHPASLPEVTRGTLKDDLFRRDFTINAMAIDISRNNFGRLIDFFNGGEDLRSKKIRVLHLLSFIDDPTRILRAIRFEKRYNFGIEPRTLSYLREAIKLKMLEKVQPQRLRNELILTLKENQPLKQIKRIGELTGLGFINSNLTLSQKTYTLLKSAENQINWFKKTYPHRRSLDTWLIYLIAILDSLSLKDTTSVLKSFSFRRGEEKRMLNYKKVASRIIVILSQAEIKPAKIFTLLEPLSYEVILLIKAKSKNKNVKRCIEDFFEIYHGMCLSVCAEDLRKLGLAPGPRYQKIFAKTLEAKINNKIKTREEELTLIRKLIAVK